MFWIYNEQHVPSYKLVTFVTFTQNEYTNLNCKQIIDTERPVPCNPVPCNSVWGHSYASKHSTSSLLGYGSWLGLKLICFSSHSIPPSLPIWLIHSNFLRDSFLTKKRSISPARSKVRSRGIIDDLPGQTLSYLSPPDLSSAIIHHKLKLYSGGVALAPLSAQPFVQRSSPPLHLELLEGAALKPAVQHLCCSGQMVITESICQTQAPSLVANRHLLFSSRLAPLFSCHYILASFFFCLFTHLRLSVLFFPVVFTQVHVHVSFLRNDAPLTHICHSQ